MKESENKTFGVRDLRSMAPGEEKTFMFPTGITRASFSISAYREPVLHPRKDVLRYQLHQHKATEEGKYPLTVKAIPV